ncbi:MAG: CocE/NonD family hydrolase [Bacteriovoracaceae bacterium]|nr:CocE/NonD family hydrolase [Bacteriovoracaceae bacterium]
MKYLIFIVSMVISINSIAANYELYEKRAKQICKQMQGETDYIYDEHYAQNIIDTFPKDKFDEMFTSLISEYGKCNTFKFPGFSEDSSSLQMITDKGKNIAWKIALNDKGKLNTIKCTGIVDNTPIEKNTVYVEMRDGTRLVTIIYRKPNDDVKRPVILTRTPYLPIISWEKKAKYFVKRGYTFVLQSIRGMHGSEGIYRLFSDYESTDGFDTINWIADQNFSNGKVAITGTSYDGFTALAAGVDNPKPLKVIFTGGAPSEIKYHCFRQNGIILTSVLDYLRYNQLSSTPAFTSNYTNLVLEKLTTQTNQEDFDEILFGVDLSEWNSLIRFNRNTDHTFFEERSIYDEIKNIKIPTYHIAGMRHDGDLIDTIRNFQEADRNLNRNFHHLYLGYWDHGNSTPYSEDGTALFVSKRFDSLVNYYLNSIKTKYAHEPRVFMESEIGGEFLSGDTFPLPHHTLKMYFTNNGIDKNMDLDPTGDSYKFIPKTAYSDEQMVEYSFVAQEEINIMGEISFDLNFSFDTPQMDLIISFAKKDINGKEQFVTGCLLPTVVKNTENIVNVKMDSCPMINTLKKGEEFIVSLHSNIFPYAFRSYNNENGTGYMESNITFMHSLDYPSSLTLSLKR